MSLLRNKKFMTMLVALLAACYGHFVEPVPEVDPALWDLTIALSGVGVAYQAGKGMPIMAILDAARKLGPAKKSIKEALSDDPAGDDKEHG